MADFDLFKVKVIDQYFSILENGLTLTKRRGYGGVVKSGVLSERFFRD